MLTTGTGSSTAGLTCAAIKDSGNEFSLEAGALALADRGVCCIDEFGCMSKEDRTSIHEAMEQQTISVAKAGIVCKLNARATVVAVMNPNGGIFDNTQSVETNSRLGSALLSRFDLIFIMMDQASAERDKKISEFLLQQSITPGSGYERPVEIEKNLNDGDTNGHWSMEKLRVYIAIVRDKLHPTLTPEASELLQKHYNLCRQSQPKCRNALPVTVRFLESLIRLSQAHARLMFRDKVTVDDAVAVILLMDCTATAYQNSSGDYYTPDDFIFNNPIDTAFPLFASADDDFRDQKVKLLSRYDNNGQTRDDFNCFQQEGYDNNRRDFNGCSQRTPGKQQDQWGRHNMSQRHTNVPTPPSEKMHEIRNTMVMMEEDNSPNAQQTNDNYTHDSNDNHPHSHHTNMNTHHNIYIQSSQANNHHSWPGDAVLSSHRSNTKPRRSAD